MRTTRAIPIVPMLTAVLWAAPILGLPMAAQAQAPNPTVIPAPAGESPAAQAQVPDTPSEAPAAPQQTPTPQEAAAAAPEEANPLSNEHLDQLAKLLEEMRATDDLNKRWELMAEHMRSMGFDAGAGMGPGPGGMPPYGMGPYGRGMGPGPCAGYGPGTAPRWGYGPGPRMAPPRSMPPRRYREDLGLRLNQIEEQITRMQDTLDRMAGGQKQ